MTRSLQCKERSLCNGLGFPVFVLVLITELQSTFDSFVEHAVPSVDVEIESPWDSGSGISVFEVGQWSLSGRCLWTPQWMLIRSRMLAMCFPPEVVGVWASGRKSRCTTTNIAARTGSVQGQWGSERRGNTRDEARQCGIYTDLDPLTRAVLVKILICRIPGGPVVE
jgi:hypothetical protein